jgi:hypothetical protein
MVWSHSNKNSMVLAWKEKCTIEDPEISLHSYSHLIFDKGAANIHWRKDSLFNK